jgi:hypothetical protein
MVLQTALVSKLGLGRGDIAGKQAPRKPLQIYDG